MWKDFLDYKKSTKELQPKTRELDLLILKKVEQLAERRDVNLMIAAPKKTEVKKVAKLKAPGKEMKT